MEIGNAKAAASTFEPAVSTVSRQRAERVKRIEMAMTKRPLSPHLQVYRLPMTAVFSITHRLTGVVLSLGLVILAFLLKALADGPESYFGMQGFFASIAGRIFLSIWVFALFFHLCHGIRHLIWDTGYGFTPETLDRDAWIEFAASIVLTLAVWLIN